ncbi:hypothetical protein QYM36_013033 [Artemia franciscana]|uniref:Uncharacterized protein n=1 Tax=Artemia franciscana TaxID=6661 RepID=A0AA88HP49_ARTSF|nr:hypothetical protein QYM36_013033 [Artemia franciscana]
MQTWFNTKYYCSALTLVTAVTVLDLASSGLRDSYEKGLNARIAEEARPVSISSSEDPNLARPTLETDFIKESCNHFNQPLLEMIDEDKDSMEHYIRDWKFFKNCKIRTGIYEEVRKLSTSRLEEQIFLQKNPYQPTALRFHPYYPWLAVADKSGCSFWDFDTNMRFAYISNQRDARITAADFVNAHDNTLIMLGSDDGSVKIWKENRIINGSFGNESLDKPLLSETTGTSLVTAWQCLPELVPSTRGSGMVLHWDQLRELLIASGDVKIIRLWDANVELKLGDIPTGLDGCVTQISSDRSSGQMILAGFSNGSVGLYDRRKKPQQSQVISWKEHSRWILDSAFLSTSAAGTHIISGSISGEVRIFDVRKSSSVYTLKATSGMTAMTIHPGTDLFACASVNQTVNIYNGRGLVVGCVKFHEGFMGSRISSVASMAFNPYKLQLASGSVDSTIAVFSTGKSIRK